MKILSVLSFLSLFIGSCNVSKKSSEATSPRLQINKAGIFENFQVLNIPKENISIGSEWIEGIGPTTLNVSQKDLQEINSLTQYNFNDSSDFSLKIKSSIASYFGLSGMLTNSKTYDLKIESASIVRLDNIDKLNYSAGSTYIWEGIKIKSFTLATELNKGDSVGIQIKDVNKDIEISPYVGAPQKKTFLIKGFNLFVAFRLVNFSDVFSEIKNDIDYEFEPFVDRSSFINDKITIVPMATYNRSIPVYTSYLKSFHINTKFDVKFYSENQYVAAEYNDSLEYQSEQKNSLIWPNLKRMNNCNNLLIIQFNNKVLDRQYKSLKFKVGKCSDSFTYLLTAQIEEDKFVTDELQIEGLEFDSDSKYPFIKRFYSYKNKNVTNEVISPKIIHRQNKIYIRTLKGNAPGW